MIRKFTKAEGPATPVSPTAHEAVQEELQRIGKTSAQELSEVERNDLRRVVEESDHPVW